MLSFRYRYRTILSAPRVLSRLRVECIGMLRAVRPCSGQRLTVGGRDEIMEFGSEDPSSSLGFLCFSGGTSLLPGVAAFFSASQRIDESGLSGLEKERRLTYVGVHPRARDLHHILRRQPPGFRPLADSPRELLGARAVAR